MADVPAWLLRTLIRAPGLLVGITVHEFFHAWTAWKLGDDTPRQMGRVTLNPFAHLDPLGTLMILFGPFGWGKPVPVNKYNFRDPSRDDMVVAIMGPVSNLCVAFGFAIVLFLVKQMDLDSTVLLEVAILMGVVINVALMIFNLIPLYPLDGSHVMEGLLPYEQRESYRAFSRFSPFILLAIILFFGRFLFVPIFTVARLVLMPFGLQEELTRLFGA